MADSIVEKINAIEQEAKDKIEALRSGALSELVKRIAKAKSELAQLEGEYVKLTGKDLRGQPKEVTRRRLTGSQKNELQEKVTDIIANAKDGVAMGEIVKRTGAPVSSVRLAVKRVKGIKSTGTKATTVYFLQ